MRTAPVGIGFTNEPYFKNFLYDDLAPQFTGSQKEFTLTADHQNITGVTTSTLILINGVFQGIGPNYTVSETTGITSITFTGTASSVSYDINNANVPTGGVIVSVASSAGFGYQPLVSAGGTAVVSGVGTISSISIGNTGSGYRSGIQTTVNVGVGTSSTGTPNIVAIGTAQILNGHIVSIAVTNPGVGYTRSNPPTDSLMLHYLTQIYLWFTPQVLVELELEQKLIL